MEMAPGRAILAESDAKQRSSPTTGNAEMNRGRRTGGYTLFELLAVLVVFGVITASTMLLGRRVIARQQLSGAARTLATDLARARIRAIQTNAPATIRRESSHTSV